MLRTIQNIEDFWKRALATEQLDQAALKKIFQDNKKLKTKLTAHFNKVDGLEDYRVDGDEVKKALEAIDGTNTEALKEFIDNQIEIRDIRHYLIYLEKI